MSSSTSILLLSNSKNFGGSFLAHALDPIADLLQGEDLTFVPFALADHQGYGDIVKSALSQLPVKVHVAPPSQDGAKMIAEAPNLFVGGGNTFRLLKTMLGLGVMDLIQKRYRDGDLRYMGSSAGTNLACPTIRTTNDMPIVFPGTFEALGLVPFQINAHFQDDEAFEGHMGETRSTRLTEFLEENDVPVLALREGSWIAGTLEGTLTLGGDNGALIFTRSLDGEREVKPVDDYHLDELTSSRSIYDSPNRVAASVDSQ